MTVYESDSGLACPLLPIGNGKMLVCLAGVAVWSLQCGYTAPSFLSISPDTSGGYYESESEEITEKGIVSHRMLFTASSLNRQKNQSCEPRCDLRLTDCMAIGEGIFLRVLEGKSPFHWKLSFPSIASVSVVSDYHLLHCAADALFCSLPAGTPFDSGLVLTEEKALTLYLCGDLHFEEKGRTVVFEGGGGYMLFIDSSQPLPALKQADKCLCQLKEGILPERLPLFADAQTYWQERLSGVSNRSNPKAAEAAAALLSMQSEGGVIISDLWHPYGLAADLPLLTEALLKIDCYDLAYKMVMCWAEQLGKTSDGIPSILGCDGSAFCGVEVSDGAPTAAFLLAAVKLIQMKDKLTDRQAEEQLYRKMRKAFTVTINCLGEGMLPFSGNEDCFDSRLLDRDCVFHGSSVATAMAIAAAEGYIGYCERSGRKIARESERYLTELQAARSSFEQHFGSNKLYRLNAAQFEGKHRHPRFLRGVCPKCSIDGAFAAVELLELDQTGRYRCKRCYTAQAGTISQENAALHGIQSIESIDATAAIAFWMPSPFSERALAQAEAFYRVASDGQSQLPMRLGRSDAMLWAAARRNGRSAQKLFRQALVECAILDEDPRLALGALPSVWVDGNEMKGAACSSTAIAALILALL